MRTARMCTRMYRGPLAEVDLWGSLNRYHYHGTYFSPQRPGQGWTWDQLLAALVAATPLVLEHHRPICCERRFDQG